MFKKLINWLTRSNYQSNIDAYIASKSPTSAAEVEYWINQYTYGTRRSFL